MREIKNTSDSFEGKVWKTAGIVALMVIVIWLLKVTFSVLLLVLAGALIGLYFRGLSGLLQRKARLSPKLSLPISIIGSLLLVIAFFWFAGHRIQQQISELTETLPSAVEQFRGKLSQSAIGNKALEQIESAGNGAKLTSAAGSLFSSTFGLLADVYVVLFLGIFFTAAPSLYVNGLTRLVPPAQRNLAKQILSSIGNQLTKWLKGKLFSMLVVAVLTATGLLIIGVPMAFALALIAGLLSFIPNFGPVLALVPAVLTGLMQGTTTALLVAALYILVQVIESNLITPKIQQRLIKIPPALIILAQLFMGVLTGGWGLVLATPLVVIMIVLIRKLYIEKMEAGEVG